MKSLKLFIAACAVALFSLSVQAQDIHFSQFYSSPLNLNPAMTGVMNCNIRLVGNYRNQWASVLKNYAYNTYSVSYDQKMATGRYDYFGVGGTLWGDRAGQSKFSTLQARVSGSYSKRMAGTRKKAHYLVVGIDAGLTQRSIDFNALKWGSQYNYDTHDWDETILSGEEFDRDNFLYPDLAAGLLWMSVFSKESNFYMGGAFHHINRANVSWDKDKNISQFSKFTFHAGGEFMLGDKIGLIPGAVTFFQGPSWELNAGTSFKFLLGNSRRSTQAFQLGAWTRLAHRLNEGNLADAVILSTRFDYEDFSIGFSYDVNISDLKPASNNNGAFEFALIYKICGPERRGVYCPNF